jgi:hypothetical protein
MIAAAVNQIARLMVDWMKERFFQNRTIQKLRGSFDTNLFDTNLFDTNLFDTNLFDTNRVAAKL